MNRFSKGSIALLLVTSFFLVSCGGGSGGGSAPTPQPQQPQPPTPPPPPPPPAALTNPVEASIATGSIQVTAVNFVQSEKTEDQARPGGTNSPHARLQYLQQAQGLSDRFYFNDTRGLLWAYEESWEAPQLYIDLREEDVGFQADAFPNEAGFLGFAFHPQFAVEDSPGFGKLYTAFSANAGGTADFVESAQSVQESVLYEWTATNPTAVPFEGEGRELFRVGQFAGNHNIGNVAFNPTADAASSDFGMLYVSLGDGGGAHDPGGHGQNANSILGTIVRIDPLGGGDDNKYGIPADNPFASGESGLPEIWAYGLRHPQHFSWDRMDGRMFLLDIGQDQVEEVNLGVAGGNYGWRLREGTFATVFGVETTDGAGGVYERGDGTDSFIYPVAQYDHDEGFAIGSGFVYRGSAIADLVGMYVFTDIVRGRVFYIETSNLTPDSPTTIFELSITVDGTEESLVDVAGHTSTYPHHSPYDQRVDLRISEDSSGELYLLSKGDGWIRKLVSSAQE